MGNELGCASGEKSSKAQWAEERYQASAPLEAAPPAAAAASPATDEKAVAAEAPLPNDRVAEPDLKAEAAPPGLHAAVNLDDATTAAERPPEGADASASQQQEERPPVAEAVEEEAVAPAVAPPVCEEPVVASFSAPAQMAEAPHSEPVQPESSSVPDAEADNSADKTSGDVGTATVVAAVAAEVSAVDSSTAPAGEPASANAIVEPAESPLPDAIANDARQQQPAVPVVVVSAENESAADATEEAGLQQQPLPPPEIAICPPPSIEESEEQKEEQEQQQAPAASDAVPSAEPDRPVVTVEVTSADEFPLPPSRDVIIAGPCAAYPGDEHDETATEVPTVLPDLEPAVAIAADAEAAQPAEGDSELMPPPPPPAEPLPDNAASEALEAGSIVPPIVINGAGELQSDAENEESIAAAVLAAGNRSLELSAPGAENGSQPQVSSPSKDDSAAAGDGLDSQEKMNGDSDAASHECTTPTSPTGAEGGAGSQKKAKTGTTSHSRIPVLQE